MGNKPAGFIEKVREFYERRRNLIFAALGIILVMIIIGQGCVSCLRCIPKKAAPEELAAENSGLNTGKGFETFAKNYIIDSFMKKPIDIHQTFRYHEEYGFPKKYEVSLGRPYTYPSEEEIAKERENMEKFKQQFDPSRYNADLKTTYALLDYNFGLYDDFLKFFYHREPLTSGTGEHITLPLAISEYKLQSELDLQNYILLCEDIPDYLNHIIEFEREKAGKDLFMTNSNLDAVLQELSIFTDTDLDGNPLYSSFVKEIERFFDENKVDASQSDISSSDEIQPEISQSDTGIRSNPESDSESGSDEKLRVGSPPDAGLFQPDKYDSLSRKEIDEYISQLEQVLSAKVIPAYRTLSRDLSALRGQGRHGGLFEEPQGTEYVEYRLREMGFADPPDVLIEKLEAMIAQLAEEGRDLTPPANYRNELSGYSPESIVDYLTRNSTTGFPAPPEGTRCNLKSMNPALDGTTFPAVYFMPQIDSPRESTLMVNDAYFYADSGNVYPFTIMAHEGLPGKMLHVTTVFAQKINPLRQTQWYSGNYEGWASYAEYYAFKYFPGEEEENQSERIDYLIHLLLMSRMELGVSYQGWTEHDMLECSKKTYGTVFGGDAARMSYLHQNMINYPLSYVSQGCGVQQITELREAFRHLPDKEFNTGFMAAGSLPFSVMKNYFNDRFSGTFDGIEPVSESDIKQDPTPAEPVSDSSVSGVEVEALEPV